MLMGRRRWKINDDCKKNVMIKAWLKGDDKLRIPSPKCKVCKVFFVNQTFKHQNLVLLFILLSLCYVYIQTLR